MRSLSFLSFLPSHPSNVHDFHRRCALLRVLCTLSLSYIENHTGEGSQRPTFSFFLFPLSFLHQHRRTQAPLTLRYLTTSFFPLLSSILPIAINALNKTFYIFLLLLPLPFLGDVSDDYRLVIAMYVDGVCACVRVCCNACVCGLTFIAMHITFILYVYIY